MSELNTKTMLGLSIQKNRLVLVGMENGQISGMTMSEMENTFHFRDVLDNKSEIQKQYSKTIKEMIQQIKSRSNDIGVVVGREMVLLKRIPVALALEESMIRKQLQWEAEQFCISPIKEYVLDFQRLPFQTSSGNNIYLMVMLRKKVAQAIRKIINGLGLNLQSIDVDIFSKIRTLLYNHDVDNNDTIVLIDIHNEEIVFIFIREREYFLSHHISFHLNQEMITETDCNQIVNVIKKELKRLIFGHRLGREIEDLDHIYVTGYTGIDHVIKELSSAIEVKTEMVNPFQKLSLNPNITQSQNLKELPERYINSIGIFLK